VEDAHEFVHSFRHLRGAPCRHAAAPVPPHRDTLDVAGGQRLSAVEHAPLDDARVADQFVVLDDERVIAPEHVVVGVVGDAVDALVADVGPLVVTGSLSPV